MSDIDTAVVDSLKALDPERPIREATKFCDAAKCREGPGADVLSSCCRGRWLRDWPVGRDRGHDLLRVHNRAGIVPDVDIESGVQHLVRIVCCSVQTTVTS